MLRAIRSSASASSASASPTAAAAAAASKPLTRSASASSLFVPSSTTASPLGLSPASSRPSSPSPPSRSASPTAATVTGSLRSSLLPSRRLLHSSSQMSKTRPSAFTSLMGVSTPNLSTDNLHKHVSNVVEEEEEVPLPTAPPEFSEVPSLGNAASWKQWENTLNHCVKAIVSIRVNLVASFDTERSTSTQASGFVVDAERGIILTNRHVVSPNPITAEAIFYDHEEVPIWPVYRDPVHDFGFFKFDVSKVNFMKISSINLAPEHVRVGVEVRVVGNDAGEKLSILAGTLARLDRKAPHYGVGKYNDFNTFYYQAASSTSGGSSGSPVLDINGNAIAMNAGGKKKAASSYYIPLDRVKRALELIQQDMPVSRGTLQTIFHYQPYDEVRRLGLQKATEQRMRKTYADETGMLVVEQVLPKGPGDGLLEPGDILVEMNGTLISRFIDLEEILDSSVGSQINVKIERGGQEISFDVTVGDLHAITPNSYVSISGAILNEFSYQMARSYCIPVGGVYVASPGYMLNMAGIGRSCVITAVDKTPTPTLDAFVRAINELPDSARVPFRYFSLADIHRERVTVVQIDRHWHEFKKATRNDSTGLWDFEKYPPAKSVFQPAPATTSFITLGKTEGPSSTLIPSLVSVEFYIPFSVDGVHGTKFIGTGLIVDAEKGLVVVDANTVPIVMGDLWITFAASLVVPGKVEYLHPIHNFVVISYNPKSIGETQARGATLSTEPLSQGDPVHLVGLYKPHVPVARKTNVTKIRDISLRECNPPRYRATNIEGIEVDNPVSCQGGVLSDEKGAVQALWSSFSFQDGEGEDSQFYIGLPVDVIRPVIEQLRTGTSPQLRSLEVELTPIQIVQARDLGLSDEWMKKLEKANPSKRSALAVRRLTAGAPAALLLKEGDLILSANDSPVTTFRDLDMEFSQKELNLKILREGQEIDLIVPTAPISGLGTERIVSWAGVLLQEPHRSASQQRKTLPQGVYSSWWSNGSPAHMYGLRATVWITEVDGKPVTSLDSFLSVIYEWEQNNTEESYVRVKTLDFGNKVKVLTLKPNDHYWPLGELRKDPSSPSGWKMTSKEEIFAQFAASKL